MERPSSKQEWEYICLNMQKDVYTWEMYMEKYTSNIQVIYKLLLNETKFYTCC